MIPVAARTGVGRPVVEDLLADSEVSPIGRQPLGVGIGVSTARAFPSRRPAMSSGSVTTS